MNLRRSAVIVAISLVATACAADTAVDAETSTTSAVTGSSSTAPASTTTVPGLPVDDEGRTIAAISGEWLPAYPSAGTDTAIGMMIPTVEGRGVDGSLMAIGPRAEPQAIVFLAHWCPHCRSEVADYSDWLATSSLPEGTSLVGVTTAIDPLRQNYPPEDWLLGAGWPVPTLVDPTNEVAQAFGLTAFPFWVLVDANGVVVIRGAGSIAPESIAEAMATIVSGDSAG
ncbi:MAG: TlpA family protein disulfide reductase [Acidimicrobiia bacterium]|nr:TlpA family protein disulfide reductase [Acidimicrobiia bacterium]